ncbi:GGDEF domain-containing protein [Luteimonas deserti]|uniref:diguanylate cyclase n=1 Tax=Luteimonas deserti TaxID=2752306 RepID=A0A7Z0QPS3_9GAMM|nr:GGDEF domain-containing protein [Luteimonas deserti]NYZ62458.1 GGDEF domain-containing protein [Luteimonas deserti]
MPERPAVSADAPSYPHDLLVQEVRETRQRARLGGGFYAVAAALVFSVVGFGEPWRLVGLGVVGLLAGLALLRVLLPLSVAPDPREARRYRVAVWTIVLLTTVVWGALSAWARVALPEPAPLIALLFSGASGMALAHTLCMRRLPSALAILAVMLPSLAMLWREVAVAVGVTWLVYTAYMLAVMLRSHREYWTRLGLEAQLRHQRDGFERQSRADGLTGLANRREFQDALERAIIDARDGQPLSLLILDIDHFKRVNDSFGHAAGDACLAVFAERLERAFPPPAPVCARLGGEEFAVVLRDDANGAHARAEAFRGALASAPMTFDGLDETITVSIGCSIFDPARHTETELLYRDADAALYRAKSGGRNRTEHARAAG